MSQSRKNGAMRQRIAFETARIMAEQHGLDMAVARQKAARRLGCSHRQLLPSQSEIEQALQEHQRLFHNDLQPATLQHLRILAAEAMASLEQFSPRLAGPVLSGLANQHSKIQLHLFVETPKEVALALLEKHIPWIDGEKTLRYSGGKRQIIPTFRFQAGDTEIELLLFPPEGLRQPPLEPLEDRPQQRASLSQLQTLIKQHP
jgi:hypothetical protein